MAADGRVPASADGRKERFTLLNLAASGLRVAGLFLLFRMDWRAGLGAGLLWLGIALDFARTRERKP